MLGTAVATQIQGCGFGSLCACTSPHVCPRYTHRCAPGWLCVPVTIPRWRFWISTSFMWCRIGSDGSIIIILMFSLQCLIFWAENIQNTSFPKSLTIRVIARNSGPAHKMSPWPSSVHFSVYFAEQGAPDSRFWVPVQYWAVGPSNTSLKVFDSASWT